MINKSSHFSSEDFLEEVKYEIKRQFGSQQAFADKLGLHRNTINHVVNAPQRLNQYWINLFAEALELDLRYYIFR